jgi:hypothetical protein
MSVGLLFSGLVIGTVGLGVFVYGKRMESIRALACGVALMAFPYFVHSVLLMWIIAAACVGGTWAIGRFGS